MATTQDASVGLKVETTFGTAVAVDRFYEFTNESFDYDKTVVQGAGLRVGGRVARSGRRVIAKTMGKGDLEVELTTKGLGTLLQCAMGAGSSALVSGSTYQQLFTLGATNANLPSATIQKGVVNAAGSVDPYTYAGSTCTGFELSADNAGIAKVKTNWIAKSVSAAGAGALAYQAPSYVSSPNLFHFAQGAVTLGGTVTAPSSTALASGGTSVANVRSFSLTVDHKVTEDRFTFGGAGTMSQPTVGLRDVKGKMSIEYVDTTVPAAHLADTELALTLTFTSSESLSTGSATFQVVIPALRLNGAIPTVNDPNLVVYDVDFTVLDNLTAAQPLWLVMRTSDAAL